MYPGWSILGQRYLDRQTETLSQSRRAVQAGAGVTWAALNSPAPAHTAPSFPHGPLLFPHFLHPVSPAGTFPQTTGRGWSGGHLFLPLHAQSNPGGWGGDGEMKTHLPLSDVSPVPVAGTAGERRRARGRLR